MVGCKRFTLEKLMDKLKLLRRGKLGVGEMQSLRVAVVNTSTSEVVRGSGVRIPTAPFLNVIFHISR